MSNILDFPCSIFQDVELRESYEKDNCICLAFSKGFIRFDYEGLQIDMTYTMDDDYGKVVGVDIT